MTSVQKHNDRRGWQQLIGADIQTVQQDTITAVDPAHCDRVEIR